MVMGEEPNWNFRMSFALLMDLVAVAGSGEVGSVSEGGLLVDSGG